MGGLAALAFWRSRSRSDRKSTRLNSSHTIISYAVFCLKKKNTPRFPFGHGLCYTPCTYSNFRLSAKSITPNELLEVNVDISFFLMIGGPPRFPLFPHTALSR